MSPKMVQFGGYLVFDVEFLKNVLNFSSASLGLFSVLFKNAILHIFARKLLGNLKNVTV